MLMPPRDLFDLNPVYESSFYWTYCEFFQLNPILEIIPTSMIEDAEVSVNGQDDEEDDDDDRTIAPLTRSDFYHDTDSEEGEFEREDLDSDSESDDDDELMEGIMKSQEDISEEEYNRCMQQVLDLLNSQGQGTREDPIDLT